MKVLFYILNFHISNYLTWFILNLGVLSLFVGYPFDTIKVRQQTHPTPEFISSVKDIMATSGLRGTENWLLETKIWEGLVIMGFMFRLLPWNDSTSCQ